MSNRNKSRHAAKPLAQPVGSPAELKQFTNGGGFYPNFSFIRYWWEGEGPRAGIKPVIQKKLTPGDDPQFGKAAKWEVLIPDNAPSEFADFDRLLDRFDAMLPPFERHALVQVKIILDPQQSWVAGYERVRSYVRGHFLPAAHPVVLVAHVPGVAGATNRSHVHAMVLSRALTIDGMGIVNHRLCSDLGHTDAWAAWQAFLGQAEA